ASILGRVIAPGRSSNGSTPAACTGTAAIGSARACPGPAAGTPGWARRCRATESARSCSPRPGTSDEPEPAPRAPVAIGVDVASIVIPTDQINGEPALIARAP